MRRTELAAAARELGSRLGRLARISDEAGATTRTFLSPAMRRANAAVGSWMREAGLSVREDPAGNLVGRMEGPRGSGTLVLGSHLDTVRDAGRFDGPLGVLLPLAALQVLKSRGPVLPFCIEVVGFSEEEGVRFSSAYLGSKGYIGRLSKADLGLRDADGVSVAQALKAASLPRSTRGRTRTGFLGYLEVHIEQGPVLESEGLAAGVVSAVAGQTRARVSFTGKAGHAGTTPMRLRRDALAGAAEFVLACEALARRTPGLVATVGRIEVRPGSTNVIPAGAELSLDVRHPGDTARRRALRRLRGLGAAIARRRRLRFQMRATQDNGSVPCAPSLTRRLRKSVRRVQGRSIDLPSGAGHDGVVLSSAMDIAMLFVRCRGGLSHHPDEHVSGADLRTALDIVVDFLAALAAENR
ncbi:MAG TPA: allantoate amidohydrolase [Opitutaceae bacterium]|jgi:allantoate deiminase